MQNAHGRMYLARDPAGQPVALKELAFVQPPHPDAVAAFEREARLLRQLSHPQIPRFLAGLQRRRGGASNSRPSAPAPPAPPAPPSEQPPPPPPPPPGGPPGSRPAGWR